MSKLVTNRIIENQALVTKIVEDETFKANLCDIAYFCVDVLKNGNRIFFAGNGGSSAQAQHLSAELSGRFLMDRAPLDVLNLSDNIAFLTAVSNDYSYEAVFSRALKAHGKTGDAVVLLTTSGTSPNIISAAKTAMELGVSTIIMTGQQGKTLAQSANYALVIPDTTTARIQEMHLLCGHIICEIVEKKMFS